MLTEFGGVPVCGDREQVFTRPYGEWKLDVVDHEAFIHRDLAFAWEWQSGDIDDSTDVGRRERVEREMRRSEGKPIPVSV